MNLKTRVIQNALMASSSWAALALTSSAAIVAAPNAGDLILGFRATGGQGGNTSYLVNVGNDLTYRNAAPGSIFTVQSLGTVGDIGADLVATYGADWSTRPDLLWGIVGTLSSVSSTVYASRPQSLLGVSSPPWPVLSDTARNTTSSAITSVIDGPIGSFRTLEASTNNPAGVFQPNSSQDSSWARQTGTAGETDFGSLSQWGSIEGNFGAGAAGTALDLQRIGSLGVTQPGTFTISNTGTVTFTAVPEPGSTLLAAGAGALALTTRRRRDAAPV